MILIWLGGAIPCHNGRAQELPHRLGLFDQPVHRAYSKEDGLPGGEVYRVAIDGQGMVYVMTGHGVFRLQGEVWKQLDERLGESLQQRLTIRRGAPPASLLDRKSETGSIRQVAQYKGESAAAAEGGLFRSDSDGWKRVLPRDGYVRWAPLDVRAVAYDVAGHLWFASPQGIGQRREEGKWNLFTGDDGLPFNDFTCIATGNKGVWFGTTNGAIRYFNGRWEFRQGRRWLVDNYVHDIAIADDGAAWIATRGGVSRIGFQSMTLREKAKFYESEINRYHRRTDLGYVGPARLAVPGDKTTAVPMASDNDGFFNGLYLGAISLGYAVTGEPALKEQATRSFEALAFLSEVTQGGSHPGPAGLIARAVVPTTGPNPNEHENAERDRKRQAEDDALWKVMNPRWPVDETGKWYWKSDASADELDGHYFGYAIYYDRVCETESEKTRVREVVRRITDHLVRHDFQIVDHDGRPTRWSALSPNELNRNESNWEERGLNSWSMLTYLSVAHHVTGDSKYRDIYLKLALDHGFALNGMTQPQVISGPGSYHQADDDMSFMNYYHLLRYENDPRLLSIYRLGAFHHWRIERYERNPFFNFVYAACCLGKMREDHWGKTDMSPPEPWLSESVDSLKRWPLDLVDWSMSNAHRIDMVPLPEYAREPGKDVGKGFRVGGYAFGVDEQSATYLEDDVWELSFEADGTRLREGTAFLLAYYMGLAHGFLLEP